MRINNQHVEDFFQNLFTKSNFYYLSNSRAEKSVKICEEKEAFKSEEEEDDLDSGESGDFRSLDGSSHSCGY